MNTIKQIFFITVLITTYSASGMFGFGRQLINKPSASHQEQNHYFSLGLLHLTSEQQQEFFSYNNSEDYNNPRFKELLVRAKFNKAVQNNPKVNPQITVAMEKTEFFFANGKHLNTLHKKNKNKLTKNDYQITQRQSAENS